MTHEPRPIRAKTLPQCVSLGLTTPRFFVPRNRLPIFASVRERSPLPAHVRTVARSHERGWDELSSHSAPRPLSSVVGLEPFFTQVLVRPSDHRGSRSNDGRTPQRRHGTVRAIRAIRPIPRAGGHTEREEIAP